MPRGDQGHAVTKATNYNPVFVFVVVVVEKKGDAQTVHVPFYGEPAEVISSSPPSFYRP